MKQQKIVSAPLSAFTNALHQSFHEAMHTLVSSVPAVDQSKWRLTDALSAWKAHIQTETDINRESQASEDTKLLQEIDQQRDRLTSYLFETIRVERNFSPLLTRSDAAQRLTRIIKPYSGIQREGYNEQTAHTDGLILDLQKQDAFQALKTLGLDAYVSQLQTLNSDFKHRIATRSATRAQGSLPNSKQQRPLTDEAYKQVCQLLTAAFIYGDAAERERINLLIRMMNQRTDEFRTRHKQSTGQGSGSTSSSTSSGGSSSGGSTTKPPRIEGE